MQKRNTYRVLVRQIDGTQRTILGTCEWAIPITSADLLLPVEQSWLAVSRHIANHIPAGDQWALVFGRYLKHQADKVRGLGGDPDEIEPSPLGHLPGPDEGQRRRLCCWLNFPIAIFAIILVLALLLPGPATLKTVLAVLSGVVIIVALLYRMFRCTCTDR